MIRRNARMRREYLFRKSLEGKEKIMYERKRKIRSALEEGRAIPTELTAEADKLRNELSLDDDAHDELTTHVDDEYSRSGEIDPKILITTSRTPSSKLKQFAKEIKLIIPNSQRINRGATVIKDVVDLCRRNDFTDIIMLHETRGEPDALIVSHLPYGPTAWFNLSNTVTRHDIAKGMPDGESIATMSEATPHLIFNEFSTKLGERVATILKNIFPPMSEKTDSKRVMTFANDNDFISFRHHKFEKTSHKEVALEEIGPRFEMQLFKLKLGTVDVEEADVEWVWRPYQNTASKRRAL